MTGRQPDQLVAPALKKRISPNQKGVQILRSDRCKDRLKIDLCSRIEDPHADSKRLCAGLHVSDLRQGARVFRVDQ